MLSNRNIRVKNVLDAFASILAEGDLIRLSYGYSLYPGLHFQGFTEYKNYYIGTRDTVSGDGDIIIFDKQTKDHIRTCSSATCPCNHPGGAQVIGDYLLITSEHHEYATSRYGYTKIALYTISESPADVKIHRMLYEDAALSSTAAGITHYTLRGAQDGWLMVNLASDGRFMFFRGSGAPLEHPFCYFSYINDAAATKPEYNVQNFNLFTDVNNDMYLMSFAVKPTADSYKNRILLDKIVIGRDGRFGLEFLAEKPVTTVHPHTTEEGVHFRYGAGLTIADENTFSIVVCEKNTNFWGNFNINRF